MIATLSPPTIKTPYCYSYSQIDTFSYSNTTLSGVILIIVKYIHPCVINLFNSFPAIFFDTITIINSLQYPHGV